MTSKKALQPLIDLTNVCTRSKTNIKPKRKFQVNYVYDRKFIDFTKKF